MEQLGNSLPTYYFEEIISGPSGENVRCSVAAFLIDRLHEAQDEIIAGWRNGNSKYVVVGTIIEALGAIAAPFTAGLSLGVGVAVAVGVVFQALGTAGGMDVDNYDNALSSDFYEYAKCKLFCI
jgi:hypothetical protein